MKRRILCFALAVLMGLLSACVMRPAIPEPTPAPTALPTPVPTPEPTPTPTPEPTPCPHLSWTDGVCDDCGAVCPHERYEDGVCVLCGRACRHEAHDPLTRACSVCGEIVPHTYSHNRCTLCGEEPVFIDHILDRELFEPNEHKGRVERLEYKTHDYMNFNGWGTDYELSKAMYVYLPYGYDPAEKYDLLILLHGMGGTEQYWLAEQQDYNYPSEDYVYTTDLLDNLLDSGWCRKMIIATPCFYRYNENMGNYYRPGDELQFLTELRQDIMPLLLRSYPTWAEEPTLEGMAAAREHFAYAGLSMGSIYAFTQFMPKCLDIFSWFGCFSGSDGNMYVLANTLNSPENADRPIYYFYNSIGTKDPMFVGHKGQYRDLTGAAQGLTDGDNAAMTILTDLPHTYAAWSTGLYNFLPVVFSLPGEG